MKRMIFCMCFLVACGDSNAGGWDIDEPSAQDPDPSPGPVPIDGPGPVPIDGPGPDPTPDPEPMVIDASDNTTCESARILESGERVRQSLEGVDRMPNCLGWEMRQRFFEVEVPPNHRGWFQSDMVVCYHERLDLGGALQCLDVTGNNASQCGSDYLNLTDIPQTFVVAATEYQDRVGDEFTIGFDAVPLSANTSCEQRLHITAGDSHAWDVRSGYSTSNPCQIVESHNAFYFHLNFAPDVEKLKVTVQPVDRTMQNLRPSIQVVEDMIAQYYPQCGLSELAFENGQCIAIDDAYFRPENPAEIIVERPEGFVDDPQASYLVIVNTGGFFVPEGDPRMEIRVEAMED